jgi:hypothetical protein
VEGLDLSIRGIREEELHESSPLVRALVVERLEMIWRACQPHINQDAGKPDPRFIEAGIRTLKELIRVYRLDQPAPGAVESSGDMVGNAELVLAGVRELEAKLQDVVQG